MSLRPSTSRPEEVRAQLEAAYRSGAHHLRAQLKRWVAAGAPLAGGLLLLSHSFRASEPDLALPLIFVSTAIVVRVPGLAFRSRFFDALARDPELLLGRPTPDAPPPVPNGLTGKWIVMQFLGFIAPVLAAALLLAAALTLLW